MPACPRLVEWRERVAREKKAAHTDEEYWGRPVPGFGDPEAEVVVLGLAPAAHGANRTGRYFTGDRSGDFLFGGLYRAGFSDSPISRRIGDARLQGLWISAAVRCAPPQNKPTPAERDACLPYAVRELELLGAKVVLCLGGFAWDAALRVYGVRPKPKFGHGAEHRSDRDPARLLPSLPAEHLHRRPHPRDARRCAPAGAGPRLADDRDAPNHLLFRIRWASVWNRLRQELE